MDFDFNKLFKDQKDITKFEKVEDIPLSDELFEVEHLIDISKILSVNKLKHSKVLIMQKYYLQILNHFEQENLDGEATFLNHEGKDELEIIENDDGTAQIVRLDQLYHVLTFFNIEIKIQAEVYRQYFQIKPIYIEELRSLCYQELIVNFIKEHTKSYIHEQFEKYGLQNRNQLEVRDKICEILLKQIQIHLSIFDIQFKNNDLDLFEKLVISKQIKQITSSQIRQFQLWRLFNIINITTVNKCFTDKYECRNKFSAAQVQELFDKQQTDYYFNKDNDISLYIQSEEKYFSISQRSTDFEFNKRIYLEIRQKDGIPFFATRNNSEYFISNLFTQQMNSLYCVSCQVDENQIEFTHAFNTIILPCQVVIFQIQNLLMNIDYKLLEYIGFNRLARYLKERTIYYIDPETKQETQINNRNGTKGVFFGEAFASDVCLIICQIISDFITKDLALYRTDAQAKVFYNYSEFFILLTPKNNNRINSALFIPQFQHLIKIVNRVIQNFGFEFQKSSIRCYCNDGNKPPLTQKIDNNGKFVQTNDLFFYEYDLLEAKKRYQKFTDEQINYLQQLLKQNIKAEDLSNNTPEQQITNYINLRLIKKFIKKGNSQILDKDELNDVFKEIYPYAQLPFFVNKIPFFN